MGLFVFSFFEYFFHRWMVHGSIRIMVDGHHTHHENPIGYDSVPFLLPALILLGLFGIFILVRPVGYAFLLTGAIAFGYVTYGLSHVLIHHFHPDCNFGVTTPLWDILLSTRYLQPEFKKKI